MSVKGNELTQGPVMRTMLRFAIPMILGDLLQQCYNIADTLIVGRFLGADALAAVGVGVFADDLSDLHPAGGWPWAAARCFPSASASRTSRG